jgi:heme-degrading monooxygenase HmoA
VKRTIPSAGAAFVTMSLIDVAGDALEEAAALAAESQRQARKAGGLRLGVVLRENGGRRVVTYSEWRSERAFLTALLDERASEELRRLSAIAERVRPMTFSLLGVRGPGGADSAEVLAGDESHCCVIVGVAEDRSKRDFMLQYNLWETERYIRTLDGFSFAAFLVGHDPRTFAEFTCWESGEQFQRAFADPEFQEHIPVNNHWCEKDVSFHRVADVTAA